MNAKSVATGAVGGSLPSREKQELRWGNYGMAIQWPFNFSSAAGMCNPLDDRPL